MTKIRKLKRKKRFRANVNRKRLRNKLNKLPNIECKQIKESWEAKKSTVKNLAQMGLAYDPNKILGIPNVKKNLLKTGRVNQSGDEEIEIENVEENIPKNLHVAKNLEEEARHPRARLFRLPNNEVQFATYMMDKYGDDYKAMMRDRKNYNQLTWRQIKAKIDRLKSIPEQYGDYLVKKGEILLDDPTPLRNPKKIKPPTLQEPVEKRNTTKLSRRKRQKKKTLWQEESIVEAGTNNDKITSDENEDSNLKLDNEKKLQLFTDEDEVDISDQSDSDEKSDEPAGRKNKNFKPNNIVQVKSNKKLKLR